MKIKEKDAILKDILEDSEILVENDHSHVKGTSTKDGVIFYPIKAGLKKYPEYAKYLWGIVDKDKNEITKKVASQEKELGYLVIAKKGTKGVFPLKTCFLINKSNTDQVVHNLIIVEDGAELHIINGCTISGETKANNHYAVTEMFVGKKATLSYTMIHDWNPDTEVYPVSAMKVDEGGVLMSNYISFEAVKMIKAYPTAYVAKDAVVRFNSIIYAPEGAHYNVGSRGILEGDGAKIEIMSRNVSSGGTVIMPAHIKSSAKGTKGHIECSALMLNNKGMMHAVPELEAEVADAELTHEAAIGKISEEELNYLMSRGLSELEATEAIIRGFLNLEIKGLPEEIKKKIDDIVEMVSHSTL